MKKYTYEFAVRFAHLREKSGLNQQTVADKLGVTPQSVSCWESGKNTPDISKIPDIAALFEVTADWLLSGKIEDLETGVSPFERELSDRLFNEKKMYTYVKTYAHIKKMYQTLKVLPYAKKKHDGQFRKGKDQVPYIYHPLQMVCHALALGLDDDNLISATMLHDVCEDTEEKVEDLPVNDTVKEAVALLTKSSGHGKMTEEELKHYYEAISKNKIALMVKMLDRCSNVSGMAAAFDKEKLVDYINETEKYFYPMIRQATTDFPEYSDQLFLLKYHISSVLAAIKHQI
mgnify:CR=1 FL=1